MSHLCDVFEEEIMGLTIETRVYEDGYVQSTLLDQFGNEIDSMDGNAQDGNVEKTRGIIEMYLIDQYIA